MSTESKGTEDPGARPAHAAGIDALANDTMDAIITAQRDYQSPQVILGIIRLALKEAGEAAPPAGGPQADADLLRRLDEAIPNIEWAGQRHVTQLLREARAELERLYGITR